MPYIWGPNTTPDSPDGLNNLKVTYPWWTHYWNFSDRVDYNISDKWRMFARFSKFKYPAGQRKLVRQQLDRRALATTAASWTR